MCPLQGSPSSSPCTYGAVSSAELSSHPLEGGRECSAPCPAVPTPSAGPSPSTLPSPPEPRLSIVCHLSLNRYHSLNLGGFLPPSLLPHTFPELPQVRLRQPSPQLCSTLLSLNSRGRQSHSDALTLEFESLDVSRGQCKNAVPTQDVPFCSCALRRCWALKVHAFSSSHLPCPAHHFLFGPPPRSGILPLGLCPSCPFSSSLGR